MNSLHQDAQYRLWDNIFASNEYYYGSEPGPVARRAVRYHRPGCPHGGAALDAGCGEGQDLAFLAANGYHATGIEFTPHGVAKAQHLLATRGLNAEIEVQDLRTYSFTRQFDLVIAINCIQFLGADASACLDRILEAVSPGGVIGLSLFAREESQPSLHNGIFYISLPELMARFSQGAHGGRNQGHWQLLEAAQLWQWNKWNQYSNEPQAFVTLIAQRLTA